MSFQKHLSCHLILTLSVLTGAEVAHRYLTSQAKCIYSSPDLSDMVYVNSIYLNKFVIAQFNSTLGKFVGFSKNGMIVADSWNNSTVLLSERTGASVCKFLIGKYFIDENAKPTVMLSLVTQGNGRHPAILMCSAYDFYPSHIKVSWLRDGKVMTSEVTSTMEMANGDWFYQIHSELEYSPKSGEKISCMVEHASFTKPMIYDWDPSLPQAQKNKIVIGASGLVLGIITTAAGLIYYKKKINWKDPST